LKKYWYNIIEDTVEVETIPNQEWEVRVLRSREGFDYHHGTREKKSTYSKVIKAKKEGKWLYWHKKGKLIKEEIYLNDSLISMQILQKNK